MRRKKLKCVEGSEPRGRKGRGKNKIKYEWNDGEENERSN